jgi:hypothetical protein
LLGHSTRAPDSAPQPPGAAARQPCVPPAPGWAAHPAVLQVAAVPQLAALVEAPAPQGAVLCVSGGGSRGLCERPRVGASAVLAIACSRRNLRPAPTRAPSPVTPPPRRGPLTHHGHRVRAARRDARRALPRERRDGAREGLAAAARVAEAPVLSVAPRRHEAREARHRPAGRGRPRRWLLAAAAPHSAGARRSRAARRGAVGERPGRCPRSGRLWGG